MATDKTTNQSSYGGEIANDSYGRLPLSKHEYDLYYEEDDISLPVIRVKRTGGEATEKWRILSNNKEVLTIDGTKFGKKEREFLRTPEGFNFILLQYKNGISAISKIKQELKSALNKK